MIMGQGKTTVIAPMLALLLANGRRLVQIVCPAPLLEMSRSVTRNCFANVIRKRVYTFTFVTETPKVECITKAHALRRRCRT